MLQFFRRYQRFFFLVITIVIVVSFSFFGTYSTLGTGDSPREQVAFVAVDGSKVTRGELDEMTIFLSTDSYDKLQFNGAWGPNFLNDGVIQKDFLMTGLGLMLVDPYRNDFKTDLQTRLDKEKRYTFYVHPHAKFINAETAWGYFAPDLKENFQALRTAENGSDPAAFAARVQLFLAEKKFPAPMLRQVLHYQEQQYNWLPADENLNRQDLSLFGYHTAEDWFGPRFMRVVAQFIINSAKIAEQKGYKVTKEEVLVDLLHNAEVSYQQNSNSPSLGVPNAQQYYNEQLRIMTMDQNQAIKIWRQVLLFRRLFQDVGNAVFVAPFEYQKFDEYAKETVEGNLYRLPVPLRLAKYPELQKFEVYLDAVSKKGNSLALPALFLSASEVEKQYPELVQKRYLLEIGEFNKKNLQAKVSVKETWNWEVDEKNWNVLKTQFPELGMKKGSTREERNDSLDALDDKTRFKIDAFARAAIVDTHPEWLNSALEQAKPKKMVVGIRLKNSKTPFVGLENADELMTLLDSKTEKAAEQLAAFSADQNTYYRIHVIDRNPSKEVLTFAEANGDGLLDKLLTKKLEADYVSIRESRPLEFQKADKTWKDLSEVQEAVASHYFEPILKAIREENPQIKAETWSGDLYANYRLFKYVKDVKTKIQSKPELASAITQKPKEQEAIAEDKLLPREDLKNQWKLDDVNYHLSRSDKVGAQDPVDPVELFSLSINGWSKVNNSLNGDSAFFHLKEKINSTNQASLALKMEKIQQLLSFEAQRILMEKVMSEIQGKNAISLDYLKTAEEKL